MTRPLVSVCIPARDHARHLSGAIASALAQDVPLEVLVHDDASTDGTADVARASGDPRVRVVSHARRIGVAANRSSCVAAASGSHIAWLDADDELLPGALARQVAVLEAHPEVALVHAGHEVVDEGGRRLPDWPAPFPGDAVEPSAVAFGHLLAANELATSTVVVRAAVQRAAGPFATDVGRSSTDWEMWLRLALRGAVAYTAAPGARYRRHANSITRGSAAGGERLRCDVRVVSRILRLEAGRIPDLRRARRVAAAALAAKALLHAGEAHTRGAREEARDAVTLGARLVPAVGGPELLDAMGRGDDLACLRLTRAALGRLVGELAGTRFARRVERAAAGDPAWTTGLERAGAAVARATPPGAVVAAVAKWDPTLLVHAGRAGTNFPDRVLLPDGYPRDGAAAVAHLEALRRRDGVTHVVVPAVSAWWLEHYGELAERLGPPAFEDGDCRIFALRPAA
jgi:glycosyltransferase involved in cell wall biosynthesis